MYLYEVFYDGVSLRFRKSNQHTHIHTFNKYQCIILLLLLLYTIFTFTNNANDMIYLLHIN